MPTLGRHEADRSDHGRQNQRKGYAKEWRGAAARHTGLGVNVFGHVLEQIWLIGQDARRERKQRESHHPDQQGGSSHRGRITGTREPVAHHSRLRSATDEAPAPSASKIRRVASDLLSV
jgi:hypothetical protein